MKYRIFYTLQEIGNVYVLIVLIVLYFPGNWRGDDYVLGHGCKGADTTQWGCQVGHLQKEIFGISVDYKAVDMKLYILKLQVDSRQLTLEIRPLFLVN